MGLSTARGEGKACGAASGALDGSTAESCLCRRGLEGRQDSTPPHSTARPARRPRTCQGRHISRGCHRDAEHTTSPTEQGAQRHGGVTSVEKPLRCWRGGRPCPQGALISPQGQLEAWRGQVEPAGATVSRSALGCWPLHRLLACRAPVGAEPTRVTSVRPRERHRTGWGWGWGEQRVPLSPGKGGRVPQAAARGSRAAGVINTDKLGLFRASEHLSQLWPPVPSCPRGEPSPTGPARQRLSQDGFSWWDLIPLPEVGLEGDSDDKDTVFPWN